MADITVSEGSIKLTNSPRVPTTLRLFAMSDFYLADGTPIQATSPQPNVQNGNAYQIIDLEPGEEESPTIYSFEEFTMPSTTDAARNAVGARWGLYVFDAKDRMMFEVAQLGSFHLADTPTTVTLKDIADQQSTAVPFPSGDQTVTGSLTVTGNETVAGTLSVGGLAVLNGGALIPGTNPLTFTTSNFGAPSLTNNLLGTRVGMYMPDAPLHTAFGMRVGAGWFNTDAAYSWEWYFSAVQKHIMTTAGMAFGASSLNSKAVLQADSTSRGFLPPRMTTIERDAIASPPEGLVIFNLTTHRLESYNSASWDAEYLDGSGTANAYSIFTDADTLGNGYLKQLANGVGIDGTTSGPYFDVMTTGLVGDANYTKARLYAEPSVVELTALAGGTFSAQSTSIRLKCIGASGDIQFETGTGILWKLTGLNWVPQLITQGIGAAALPLGFLRMGSGGGVEFYNSSVKQCIIRSDTLNHVTFRKGDNSAGAILDADALNVTDDAYDATSWNGSFAVPTKNALRDKIESLGGGAKNPTSNVVPYNDGTDFADSPIAVSVPGSMVNGFTVSGGATGNTPSIAATGSDSNIGVNINTKGTGQFLVASDGSTPIFRVQFDGVSSTVSCPNNLNVAEVLRFGNGGDIGMSRNAAGVLEVNNQTPGTFRDIKARGVIADSKLCVGNSAAGSTPGTVTKKLEIFDVSGASLGFVAVYDAIT